MRYTVMVFTGTGSDIVDVTDRAAKNAQECLDVLNDYTLISSHATHVVRHDDGEYSEYALTLIMAQPDIIHQP